MELSQLKLVCYLCKMRYLVASVVALFFVACFISSYSASALDTVPTKMNFQGRLTDTSGNIKANGTYNMRFKLFTVASGGSNVWSEDRLVSATQGVTVTNGTFSVQLGSITALPSNLFASGALYLEVELPTPATATTSSPTWTEGPMTPRNQMATSAYAYNAETLDGLDSASLGQLSANNVWTGTNTLNVLGANAFRVQNGSAVDMLNIDTSTATMTVSVDTTIAAGKSLTVVGGNTASRPASPTEGMVYYDTTTKQLLTYANGKWQADRSTSTKIVAASNSSQAVKDAADYVADGNGGGAGDGDQVQINAALTAAAGGKVYLAEGTYLADGTILIPNNTTLTGAGTLTKLQLDIGAASDNLIENSDTTTGTNISIKDLFFDGVLATGGTQHAIYLNGLNSNRGTITGLKERDWDFGHTLFMTGGSYLGEFVDNIVNTVSVADSSSITMFNGNLTDVVSISDDAEIINFNGNTTGGVSLTSGANIYTYSGNKGGLSLDDANVTVASASNISSLALNDSNIETLSGNYIGSQVDLTNFSYIETVTGNWMFGLSITDSGSPMTISNNTIHNLITDGFFLSNVDDSVITGNRFVNAGGSGFAINISDATSSGNYIADNTLGGMGIQDLGTGTIHGGQVNSSGNYVVQPSGTIELMKNTTIQGGTLTLGTSSVAGNVVISDGSSHTATISVGSLAGNYTYTIPVTTANDTFCLQTLANCAAGGGGVSTVGALDGGTANATGASIVGSTLYLQSASVSNAGLVNTSTQSFAGNKTFSGTVTVSGATTLNDNVTVAAGKSVTIVGGNTASRPASPSEGMIYYDTDTDKLEVYSNGKWQADRTDAVLVAASNSTQADKDAADYVANGNTGAADDGDQVQINSALTAAAGKKVVLLAGTYVADATILIPNNTILSGIGTGTVIELADLDAPDHLIENSDSTTGAGIGVRDMKLNGRKDLNSFAYQNGINLEGVGGGSGANLRVGATIQNIVAQNFNSDGIALDNSSNVRILGNTSSGNSAGIALYQVVENVVISNNEFIENSLAMYGEDVRATTFSQNLAIDNDDGIYTDAVSKSFFTENVFDSNTSWTSMLLYSASNNVIGGNTITGGNRGIAFVNSAGNTIDSNSISGIDAEGVSFNLSNSNAVTNNRISNAGGATTNEAISTTSSDSNSITGNVITDASATTTNYAIDISDSASDTNYLADNTLGGGSINDIGTGTIYANQLNSSGQLINRTTGGLAVQSSAGTNLLNVSGTASITVGASDTTGTVFVLDTKTGSGDPAGIAGGIYYNSNAGKFRCYQAGAWTDCITTATTDAQTLDTLDSTQFARTDANNTLTGTQSFTGATFAISGSANANKFNVASIFNVDSSASKVSIGASDTTGTLLVLDTKTDAGDPTGEIGAMYYNSNLSKFRCYQGAAWADCITTVSTDAQTLDTLDSTQFARTDANNTLTGTQSFTGTTFSIAGSANATKFNVGSIFNVDTSASKLSVGASDTTGTTFVLDTKTDAGDPTGEVGAMYYNSNAGKFRCYQGVAWTDCITTVSTDAQTLDGIDSLAFAQLSTSNTFSNANSIQATSTTALRVQSAAGANSFLTVDTSGAQITVGNAAADGTAVLFRLDDKNTTGDPTGVVGGMYYNSFDGKFRCYQGAAWTDCITTATTDAQTLDTLDSTQFARTDANNTLTGENTFNVLSTNAFRIQNGSAVDILKVDTVNQSVSVGSGTGTSTARLSVEGIGGSTWTTRTAAEANAWQSVAYGNGLYVAVSEDGTNRVMTSPDGITWTTRTAAEANAWQSVTYGEGLFVAVSSSGTNRAMTSPDGITWTPRTAAEANTWISVTYGNGIFVATSNDGTNRVMTSLDGNIWTPRTAAEANSWQSVTYGNGLFVATSTDGTNRVMNSPDGITWTAHTAAEANAWQSVIYGNGLLVAVSSSGTNRVMTSGDIALSTRGAAQLSGDVSVAGTLQVESQASFASSASVMGDFTAGNGLFSVDTTNSRVQIGSTTADATGVVLVLDTKNTAGDPTGVAGAMYYNSSMSKFRCYEGGWRNCSPSKLRVSSDVPSTDATNWADITGLTMSVNSGETYVFACFLTYTTAATTTAIHLSVNGPASPTALDYAVDVSTSSTARHNSAQTAYDTVTNPATGGGTTRIPAQINGTIIPSASGTLALRLKTEIGSSAATIKRGSYCTIQ